jgi:hypothetical protein
MDQVSLDTTQTGSNKAGDGNTIPAFTGASGDPFTITIPAAAVPEPSSMVLCGLAACGGALGAYRRRKARLAKRLAESESAVAIDHGR